MTPRELEEYRALRATIRERGTARVWIFVAGLGIWAALVIGTAALAALPEATLCPADTLPAVFEAVFALHTGVERVGRYIQVFYESESPDQSNWEYTAMAFGRAFSGSASDPLFGRFLLDRHDPEFHPGDPGRRGAGGMDAHWPRPRRLHRARRRRPSGTPRGSGPSTSTISRS